MEEPLPCPFCGEEVAPYELNYELNLNEDQAPIYSGDGRSTSNVIMIIVKSILV